MSHLTQERKKLVPTSYLQEEYKTRRQVFVLRFAQFKKAKNFYTTSYLQGQRPVCPKPRIPFFLVHEYWGSEATRLG